MNPMMMMMLPQLMKGSSEQQQDPMHGLMMITLMQKMQSSSSSDDYDYDYVYGYDYSYSAPSTGASASSDDYDYDYVYDDSSSSPSPLSGIIQQMLQAKMMAANQAQPVKVTVTPVDSSESDESNQLPPPVVVSANPVVVAQPVNVEIASPQGQPRQPKESRPTDQVSYRSAP